MLVREPCSAEALGHGKSSASGAGGAEARGGRLRDDGQYGARQAEVTALVDFRSFSEDGSYLQKGGALGTAAG